MALNNSFISADNIIRVTVGVKIISTSAVIGLILTIMLCSLFGKLLTELIAFGTLLGLLHGCYALLKISKSVGLLNHHSQIQQYLKKTEH